MQRREAGQLNQVVYRRRPHPDPRPAARQPRNRCRQLGLSAALHRPAWRVPTSGQRRLRRRGLRHRSVRVRGRKNSGSTTPSPPSLGVSPSPSPSPTPTPTPMPSRPPLLGPSPTPGTSTTPTPTPPPAPRARPSPTPTRTPSPTSTPGCPVRDDGNRHDRDDNGVHDLLDSDDDNTDVRDRGDRDHGDDRRHHCPTIMTMMTTRCQRNSTCSDFSD